MNNNKLLNKKELQQQATSKISDKELNKTTNYLKYNLKGLERRRTDLLGKAILGIATEEDKLRLEMVEKILKCHESGGRIDDLVDEK